MHGSRALPALLLVLSACATTPVKKPVVWPDPPETARIRFVNAFSHTIDLDTSDFSKFTRALAGGSNDPGVMQPMGLALSADGKRLYIADHGLGTVLVANFDLQYVKPFSGDEPIARPFDVAVDGKGDVYVSASAGGQVIVFNDHGEKLRTLGAGQLERPTGVAIDRKRGRIYVADSAGRKSENHRVRAFALDGKHLFDLGPRQGPPGRGSGDGQFYFPVYLALDRDGNVYVGDTMNFRIQVFDPDGKYLRKFGEAGDGPGTFSRIKGLAFDGFDNLYVVDGGHSNVQLFNKRFEPLMFFGGYAQKIEYFDIPSAIAIDPKTNVIYVSNEFVSRINVYELVNTKAEDSGTPPPAPAPGPAPAVIVK